MRLKMMIIKLLKDRAQEFINKYKEIKDQIENN
jgi:hypothetical protein